MVEIKPKVTVILAAFNGVKFIDEQLASIKSQKGVIVEVYANDDGSTDGTLERLACWQNEGLITTLKLSDRIGSTKAFLELLQLCSDKTYVAFCDQDDIWDSEKL